MDSLKKLCVWMSGIGALLICVPVMYRVHEGDLFNPASYFLWSALSLLCVVVLLRQKRGGHTMLAGYFLSDLSIGIYAYMKSGWASIGWFEWFVVFLTAVCAAVYVRRESREYRKPERERDYRPSVIINGIASVVAGIPLVVDSLLNPYRMSYGICLAYLAISAFGLFGERSFEGKFIPKLSVYYWLLIIGGIAIARPLVA